MIERTTRPTTFVIERTYGCAPATLFEAWADPAVKARWFTAPSEKWRERERKLDFRKGGRELLRGAWEGGPVTTFSALYNQIVPDKRLVYTYEMYQDDALISVSLVTVSFAPDADGTLLQYTEQGVYLDSFDDVAGRETGIAGHLDRLRAVLEQASQAG